MGAVPSRETVTPVLSHVPFYGQRQNIVVIPLLKEFFPSADCLQMRQLFAARCDSFVRYYNCANDLGSAVSAMGHTTFDGTNVPYCSTAVEQFPPEPCTLEEFYNALVVEGGERMVFERDSDMLAALQADPREVRPLPCAIAFVLASGPHPPAAGESKEGSHPAGETETPEELVELFGCHIKVSGFIGNLRLPPRADPHGPRESSDPAVDRDGAPHDYALHMYLTKSAGDHHRIHALLAAVYTYAEQWQRVCLGYTSRIKQQVASTAKQSEGSGGAADSSGRELDSPLPAGVRGHTTHLCGDLFGASAARSTGYSAHRSFLESSSVLCSVLPGTGSGGPEGNDDARACESRSIHWAMPPCGAVHLLGRRTNVPLLCFLREVRTVLCSTRLWHDLTAAQSSKKEDIGCPSTGLSPEVLSSAVGMRMWLDEAPIADSEEQKTEALVHVSVEETEVETFVEYALCCLLQSLNPLDAMRAQLEEEAKATGEEEVDEVDERHPSLVRTQGISILRLPDAQMIAEAWPSFGTPPDLRALRHVYHNFHHFWVVGPSVDARRSAAEALQSWLEEGLPILMRGEGNNTHRSSGLTRMLRTGCSAPVTTGGEPASPSVVEFLEAGCVLELVAVSDGNERALRVGYLPPEELLLGELRDACKLAREARPTDPHWVRHPESATALHEPPASLSDGLREGDVAGSSFGPDGAEAALRLREEQGIMVDGSTCLWRVELAEGVSRVIAVSPYFFKTARRKSTKRKKALPRASQLHGTALNVFYNGQVAQSPEAMPQQAVSHPPPAAHQPPGSSGEGGDQSVVGPIPSVDGDDVLGTAKSAKAKRKRRKSASAGIDNASGNRGTTSPTSAAVAVSAGAKEAEMGRRTPVRVTPSVPPPMCMYPTYIPFRHDFHSSLQEPQRGQPGMPVCRSDPNDSPYPHQQQQMPPLAPYGMGTGYYPYPVQGMVPVHLSHGYTVGHAAVPPYAPVLPPAYIPYHQPSSLPYHPPRLTGDPSKFARLPPPTSGGDMHAPGGSFNTSVGAMEAVSPGHSQPAPLALGDLGHPPRGQGGLDNHRRSTEALHANPLDPYVAPREGQPPFVFNLDDILTPTTNGSSTRYPGSVMHLPTTTGVPADGDDSEGFSSSVNVTVRVGRPHNRTSSYYSMCSEREGALTVKQGVSYTSMDSVHDASTTLSAHPSRAPAAQTSCFGGAVCLYPHSRVVSEVDTSVTARSAMGYPRVLADPNDATSHSWMVGEPDGSSQRGETTTSASTVHETSKNGGCYRWDWHKIGLNYGDDC